MRTGFLKQFCVLLITWLLPLGWFLMNWRNSPVYADSFVHSVAGLTIAAAVFCIHTILCLLTGVACYFDWQRGLLTFFVSLSTCLGFLVPMLGPAVITISEALGPIAGSR